MKTNFHRKQKWVRNNQLLRYESSEFGFESSGYQANVGTKQLVSVLAPSVQSIGNLNIYSQVFLLLSNTKRVKTNTTPLESQGCHISLFFMQVAPD